MSRGAPVLAAMSLNRRTPRKSSRTTSNDHFSPTTSSAPAIEHRRGVDVRVAAVTPAAWHKEFANPTDLGYGPRNTAGWESQPTSEDHGDRSRPQDPSGHHGARGLQAGPPCRPLRRHRLPRGDPHRCTAAAAGRRAARLHHPRRGAGFGHLRDDSGGKALQPDRHGARRRHRDPSGLGDGVRAAVGAARGRRLLDARHQRALPAAGHGANGHRRCDRDVGAQRPSYGDRRSAPRRRDRGTGAGNRDVDAVGAFVTTTVAPVVVVEDKRNTSAGAVLATLSVAAFMASLDLFIVNVAFPDIARDFPGSSLGDLSWILSGYAVLYAALLVPLGRLADRYGRLNGFLFGLGLFTAASAACAMSQNLWSLVAFRGLQAVGAAALTPTSLGLLLAATPNDRKVSAVRIWTAIGAVAAAFGPVIGGFLVEASWRWVFIVNVPVGIVGLIAARRYVPDSRDPAVTRVPDLLGAGLVAVGIGATAFGLVKGPSWGWDSAGVVAAFVLSAASLAGFWVRSSTHARPVVELALLRVRAFAWSNVTAVVFSAAFGAALLAAVLWLQDVWHWSALHTGLGLAPGPLMVPVFTFVAQRLSGRVPPGRLAALGSVLFAVGTLLIASSVGAHPSYAADFLPGWLIGGVGVGFAFPTIISAATADLPPDRSATGSAIVSMSRQIGLVLGVSVFVAVVGSPRGYVAAHAAFQRAWWVVAVVSLLGALAALG